MSINAADVRSTEYDDLDVQTVQVEAELQTDLGTGQTIVENFHSIEPLGGLARDEIAELVTLNRVITARPQGSPSDDRTATAEWETSFDSSAHFINEGTEEISEQDVEGITGLDRRTADGVDVDVLLNDIVTVVGPWEDETNGTGGAAGTARDRTVIPYRDWYGEGPTTDRHDEIFYHLFLDMFGAQNVNINLVDQYVWDVRTDPRA